MMSNPASLISLYNTKDHSDLTIKVGSADFFAHHAILKPRTPFFERATKKESGFVESKDGVVMIEDHSTHAVWRFLMYCYTGDYSAESNNIGLGESRFCSWSS
ncbi:Similar to hypothetical protein MYCTH_2306100 [Myceliophthora thermophila ATCC 42464]; acc. no. XP_003663875 [Pyronema omphalodes CBS 100304]|uniref:BTB domain-containing protein n=1 Tax=Pyronema omphalodes (strain CBS 100304) TaxID=1076935 RepID=U4LHK2_PYROM|nr:Similar to hypothetical protein MYCTH_2306100 [Myceliophthora thermophila ATCC 42464]; acc. no. XP_003663875 [Pyronema omphalodes CBS 100304]